MAVTIGAFDEIDDNEIEAERPITESLMKRLRDNSYYIDEGTNLTSESTAGKVLVADGSGGVEWSSDVGINGTFGRLGVSGTTAATIAIQTDKKLLVNFSADQRSSGGGSATTSESIGSFIVDASDDTIKGQTIGLGGGGTILNIDGTVTGSNTDIAQGSSTLWITKVSSDYSFAFNSNFSSASLTYIWL